MARVEVTFANDGGLAKQCSRCGAPFSCGRDLPSCWCTALPPLETGKIDPTADCLCRACLEAATGAGTTADPVARKGRKPSR